MASTRALPPAPGSPLFLLRLRRLHGEGKSGADIGRELGCCGATACKYRRQLGLPDNRSHPRQRRKYAELLKARLAAGSPLPIDVRWAECRGFPVEHGLPPGLPVRCVQIVLLLAERGPMDRRALCEAMGMTWRGSRASLKTHYRGGSYMAHLQAEGLVYRLARCVSKGRTPTGRGTVDNRPGLYTLTPYCVTLLEGHARGTADQ